MKIKALSTHIAADTEDIDLTQDLSPSIISTIRNAWDQYLVLRFRGQKISDDDLLRFSGYFGELDPPGPNPYGVTFLPKYPEINVISNLKSTKGIPLGNLGDGEAVWHADMTYIDEPPSGGILHALEIPLGQGHTYFANMFEAYKTLPDLLKDSINGKVLIHDSGHNSAGMIRKGYEEVSDPRQIPGARHPLITKDNQGREALFLGRRPHAYIIGMDVPESDALLDKLWEHATQNTWVWHNEWQVGDLLMWQNHYVLHRRDGFDPQSRRLLHRTQLKNFAA